MEIESSGALRVAAGSRISQVSLLSFSRTDQHKPRSLSLMSTAQILVSMSRHKPEKVGDHDTHWYAKVGTQAYIGPDMEKNFVENFNYFLIYKFKHMFWVLKRTVSMRWFF